MDLSLVMHGTIVDTANGTLLHRAAYSMMFAMKLSFDVMSNVSFLLLILYRHFKERNPGAKDLHRPIFKQLFIFTTFIVILNAVSLAIRLLWQVGILGEYGSLVALAVVVFVLFYTHSIFFSSIILFSFLAAIQRIVILHWSKYKYLVTGFYLNWLMLLVWGITLHYNYVIEYKCNNRPGVEEFICEKLVYKIINISYQFLFIAINLLTIWCYWHIKRVISRLTINSERPTIFYHFVPLFTFQNLYSISSFISMVHSNLIADPDSETKETLELISLAVFHFSAPLIPFIVSVSYVASYGTFIKYLKSITCPIWRGSSI